MPFIYERKIDDDIYDCFNKADKDCKTRDTWLGGLDLYIKKLFPQLQMRKFITVNINGRVQANSLLITFAYVVSLLEGKNPAEFALRRMTL